MKAKFFLCLLLMLTLFAFTGCTKEKEKAAPNMDDTVGISGEMERNVNRDEFTDKSMVEKDHLQNSYNTTDQSIDGSLMEQ